MNLVGIGEDGKPCTPVYTYAMNSSSPLTVSDRVRRRFADPVSAKNTDSTRQAIALLRTGLERTAGDAHEVRAPRGAGLEEARQQTGTPAHASYAPVHLLQLVSEYPAVARKVKTWQSLPSMMAAKWTCQHSVPVSYSEASWTGMLDFRTLKVGDLNGRYEWVTTHEQDTFVAQGS